jgi:predicted amidohydrolase YtcJ
MFGFDFRRALDFYTGAEREGKLPFRVREQFLLPQRELLLDFLSEGWRTGDGTPRFQIGPLKLLCDGSLGGRTAFLLEDYADAPPEAASPRGIATYGQEELNELVGVAHSSGMQVAVHAIGDGGLEMCLRAFEAAREESARLGSPASARHQVVHAQTAGGGQLARMKKLRLGGLIQPSFVPSDREMSVARLGFDRAARNCRWKTMLKMGIPLAGGSDAPVETPRPLVGIHAAVTRRSPGGNEDWTPEERLSVAEAIALYTWNGAWQTGGERRRGEILPGLDADLVVLEEDPFRVPPDDLWKIGVAMTLCGGQVTFRSEDILQ